jgi:putative copper resistance protein D
MTTALLVVARTLHIGSAILLVALPFFTAFILRPVRVGDRFERDETFCRRMIGILWTALTVEIISGAAWLWLVAAEMSDDSPWEGMTTADLQTVLFQTSFGQLWIMRGIGLVILAVSLGCLGRGGPLCQPSPRPVTWLFLTVSGGLLASLAWAGHAGADARWPVWHLVVDVIHLGAGTVWPLGLFPLALFLRRALRETGGFVEVDAVVVRRFSRASFVAVLVLLASGVANSWLLLPSWSALFASTYGWLLLAKVLVVAVMIGIGAFNRFRLLSTLPQQGAPRLVRTVIAESAFVIIVLLIVGVMGLTPPGS